MPTVNVILWLSRGGQVAGSQLLRDLLEQNGFSTRLVITGQELPSESHRADVNLFSSEISPLWLPLAKRNILIPNQEQDVRQSFGRMHAEHFSETPEQLCYLRLLDKLLVKTHHAHDIYRRLGLDASYVGFTCRDRFLPGISKAFDPWLCVIGDSFANKDVRPVLRVWERNPQFPRLLVCLHQVPPKLMPALKPLPNVVYRRERLGDDELRELQNRCAIHLCPSTMEGWGHAIVESMSAGAMLLTLNAPPMDEHVNETRGACFGYAWRKPHAFGFQYAIDEASLEQTVRRVMALPGSELKDRGRRAREYFLRNDEQFRAALVRELRLIAPTEGTNVSRADGPVQIDGSAGGESANAADAMGDVPLAGPRSASAAVVVEVSTGEMLDKISILRIKRLRLKERSALANVERELASLEAARDRQLPLSAELESLAAELEAVNAALWQTEDDLRMSEQQRDFGPAFVGLARSVYRLNDRRAALKRRVNAAAGSQLVEEKLYPDYESQPKSNALIHKFLRQGLASQQAGKLDEAESSYRKVLAQNPQQPDALHLLGVLLSQRGQHAQATDLVRRAVTLRPRTAEFHNSLGMALGREEHHAQAEASFRTAIELRAEYPEAMMNLGLSLLQQGRADDSVQIHQRSVLMQPQSAEARYNLAESLRQQGSIEAAASEYERAIERRAGYAEAYNNLGICRRQMGESELAREAFETAVHFNGDMAIAHWNLGMVLLLQGQWQEGWEQYEWRWRLKEFAEQATRFSEKTWEGGDVAGRTVLLHAEQGLGDTLQFIRYAPMLARRGARVIVEMQPGLTGLLKNMEGIGRIIPRGQPLPHFDLHVPLLSLPRLFGTTPENVPPVAAYIKPDEQLVRAWAGRLSAWHGTQRVGIAWEGSAKPDPLRSCRAGDLAALAATKGVTFFSLQNHASQSPPANLDLIDLPEANADMENTAAFICNLDLVVSVDTSIAHLAGAIGRPVWTLLPHCPDWRWLLGRDDSPWYPTMRLFRQTVRGNWGPVLDRIAGELAVFSPKPDTRMTQG